MRRMSRIMTNLDSHTNKQAEKLRNSLLQTVKGAMANNKQNGQLEIIEEDEETLKVLVSHINTANPIA